MLRDVEDEILIFCVKQHSCFIMDEWIDHPPADLTKMAAVSLFLAGMTWYGHSKELQCITNQLKPNVTDIAKLFKDASFDCGRFSNMLKMRLKNVKSIS